METLSSCIEQRGAMDAANAVSWTVRLCRAIARLHQRGGSHGRISATSIVVVGPDPALDGFLTSSDRAVDAPQYHCPERVAGGSVSPSDDTWAIAVTLYFLLTARLPFKGRDEDEVRQRIRAAAPAPLAVFDIDQDELQQILHAALHRDRPQRTIAVEPLRSDLEDWLAKRGHVAGAPLEPMPADDIASGASARRPPAAAPPARRTSPTNISSRPPGPRPRNIGGGRLKPLPKPIPPPIPGTAESHRTDVRGHLDSEPAILDELAAAAAAFEDPLSALEAAADHWSKGADVATAPVAHPASSAARDPTKRSGPSSRPPPFRNPRSSLTARAAPTPATAPTPADPKPPPELPSERSVTPAGGPATDEKPATPTPPPVQKRGRGALLLIVGAVAVTTVAAGAYFLVEGDLWARISATEAMGDRPPAQPPPTVEAMNSDGMESAAPVPVPAPSATAAPVEIPVHDLYGCVESLFPPETFVVTPKPDLSFVCSSTDPRGASGELRGVVVTSSGTEVTDGMKEWAMLGWYEMAAFAAIRSKCCPGAAPLELPQGPDACDPFTERLAAIEQGVQQNVPEDEMDALVADYTKAIYCLLKAGAARTYGRHPTPRGGEVTALQKTLARTR